MSREAAIAGALGALDGGAFRADLERRVAMRTESQEPQGAPILREYLTAEIGGTLGRLGFACSIIENPKDGRGPLLLAQRHESDAAPTVLIYGHGDVVRGQDAQWRQGLAPWRITVEGERWYGRGIADNKGQHSINIAAIEQVMRARGGTLGFNAKLLLETGEEVGSPGLAEACAAHKDALRADVLIASDGPRIAADKATIFLGARGAYNFELRVSPRPRGYHSGNWGGVIANPGTILAAAINSLVDGRGRLLVDVLRPPPIPDAVRAALAEVTVGGGPDDPPLAEGWGEPGLTPAERLFGWNTLEVLAMQCGNVDAPVGAIPPLARAVVQLRYVVGTPADRIVPILRDHLDRAGFAAVEVVPGRGEAAPATRLDPRDKWVRFAVESIRRTLGHPPVVLPNIGGTLPNHVFAHILGLPTVWIPHSYAACAQHAPDEHMLLPVIREGLQIMTGLFWDLGEAGGALLHARA